MSTHSRLLWWSGTGLRKYTHEHEKPFCGRPRKPRPLIRHALLSIVGCYGASEANLPQVLVLCHCLLFNLRCMQHLLCKYFTSLLHQQHPRFPDETSDDESYPSFRCRHNLTYHSCITWYAILLQTLLESISWPVLTNYKVVKTWVTNWSCHPHPTSSLWWSKMKTTSICPSSRYDDNSFITWSSWYTSRRCSLYNDSGWPFESILTRIASCYLRTCLHHQVSSYLSSPNRLYMMLYYHDGQRSHIALTITPVTRHLTLKFLPYTCFFAKLCITSH